MKDLLGAGTSHGVASHGVGTRVSEYSEQGPFHCKDCVYLKKKGVPDKEHGLCGEKHVLKDLQLKSASGLKIVNMEHGCCRFVEYPKGKIG